MKKGYTEKVLLAQIGKYESALAYKHNTIFQDWLNDEFGSTVDCPVCFYRFSRGAECGQDNTFQACLAIVNNEQCTGQDWFRELRNMQNRTTIDFDRARNLLTTRLKYWQAIYAEKCPVKS